MVPPPRGGHTAASPIDLTTQLATAFTTAASKTSTGRKDRERDEFTQTVIMNWRLYFAEWPQEGNTMVLPDLDPVFLAILGTGNPKKARRDLHGFLSETLRLCCSEDADRRTAATRWDARIVNDAFTTCCLTFHLLGVPLPRAGSAALNSLSLLQFVPPKERALQTQIDEAAATLPSMYLEAATRDVASLAGSKLYCPEGHIHLGTVQQMIYNKRTVCKAFCPAFERSLLWYNLNRIEQLLFQPDGQAFVQLMHSQPQVAVNLIMDLQAMDCRHVEIANNLTLTNLALAGGEVSTEQFASIGPLANTILGHLAGMISTGRPNDTYAAIPQHVFDLMSIKSKKPAASSGAGTPPANPKRNAGDSAGGHPAKVPKNDKDSAKGTPGKDGKAKTPAADLGFLEFVSAKPDSPPTFGFTVANSKKKDSSEYPCPHFAYKGFACDRKKCSLVHVTYKKLNATDQQKFVGFVESHKATTKFVPGQGPSGTT
jgi:hypothetical protein